MAYPEDTNEAEHVPVHNSNRVGQYTDTSHAHRNRFFGGDIESPRGAGMTIINNRFAMSAPPSELVSGEYHERDTFPAHPQTLHLRLRRAITLEMIIYARRELVQLGLPGEEMDCLLEDLDAGEQAMRRPQHRDVVEVASEIKSIDGNSTWAEHETARDKWRAEITVLKAAVAAREMDKEAAEKANAPAVQAAKRGCRVQ
jgi:hypothetical protein